HLQPRRRLDEVGRDGGAAADDPAVGLRRQRLQRLRRGLEVDGGLDLGLVQQAEGDGRERVGEEHAEGLRSERRRGGGHGGSGEGRLEGSGAASRRRWRSPEAGPCPAAGRRVPSASRTRGSPASFAPGHPLPQPLAPCPPTRTPRSSSPPSGSPSTSATPTTSASSSPTRTSSSTP